MSLKEDIGLFIGIGYNLLYDLGVGEMIVFYQLRYPNGIYWKVSQIGVGYVTFAEMLL